MKFYLIPHIQDLITSVGETFCDKSVTRPLTSSSLISNLLVKPSQCRISDSDSVVGPRALSLSHFQQF